MKSRLFAINNSHKISAKLNRTKLKKVNTIIIGAGPSGLSAATTLHRQGKDFLILEKETYIGGKCHTYSDPDNLQNKTEWGAALMVANYGKVIDEVEAKKVSWEAVLPSDISSIPLIKNMNDMNLLDKPEFGLKFMKQMLLFAKHAKHYQRLRDDRQDLPDDYKSSFDAFAKKYHLELINEFSYIFVPAFGYGLMEKCPAYALFEYFGMTTIPDIIFGKALFNRPVLSIKNGFQSLMEEIARDFPIQLNSTIESIDRNPQGVIVNFKANNEFFNITADNLILAISPLHWPKLGMALMPVEKECVNHLTYYQYPVAVVKLTGFPAVNYWEYNGLLDSGLGHLALITTRDDRDNPSDGRLCTAYINLTESKVGQSTHFKFTQENIKQLQDELARVPGVTKVEMIETKVWQDYMSTLPWDIRLSLDKQQMANDTHTLYLGPYTLGSFEDVACVWMQADKAVSQYMFNKKLTNDMSYYLDEMHRMTFFFTAKKALPFNVLKSPETRNLSLSGVKE